MKINSILRQAPYNFKSDYEYYKKGYKSLVGVPGRVLQAKELNDIMWFPIFSLNDITSELFSEGVVQGFEISDDSKLDTGSVFGLTLSSITDLPDVKIYEIDFTTGNRVEITVDLNELINPPIITPDNNENTADNNEILGDTSDNYYTVQVIEHTGENAWPRNIIF